MKYCVIIVSALLVVFSIHAQEAAGQFPKSLYLLMSDGTVSEYRELDTMFLIIEDNEFGSTDDIPRIDTLLIKKRLDDRNYVVTRAGQERFGIIRRAVVREDSIFSLTPAQEGTNLEEVLEKHKRQTPVVWASLMSRQLFSKAMLKKLQQAPGLDEITRDDLLASLDWRKDISEELKAYAEKNPDRPYHLRRMVQNYANQKMVLLGYNPYKQVEYNWGKQFEDDEEVIKALTEPISFD